MNDLEDRLRATYAAVAEQTVVAELPTADEHVVVPLAAARQRLPLRRVGLSIAAALVLLAGVFGVGRSHQSTGTGDSGDGRPYAIPMYVPIGFALVDAHIGSQSLPRFPTNRTTVATLEYHGPDHAVIGVSSAAEFAPPLRADRNVLLEAGWLATASVDASETALSWVRPEGAAVSVIATGVSLDELTKMADSIWYATSKNFDTATSKMGFGNHVFESWQPPGDRFDGSKVQLEGSLQPTRSDGLRVTWFDGMFSTDQLYAECRGMQLDGSGRIALFGPATVRTFVVTLPDGSLRSQRAESPWWYPSGAFASIKVDEPPPSYYTKVVPVTCEEGS